MKLRIRQDVGLRKLERKMRSGQDQDILYTCKTFLNNEFKFKKKNMASLLMVMCNLNIIVNPIQLNIFRPGKDYHSVRQ